MPTNEEFEKGTYEVHVILKNITTGIASPVEINESIGQSIIDMIHKHYGAALFHEEVSVTFRDNSKKADLREQYFDEQIIQKQINKVKEELDMEWNMRSLREYAKQRLTRMN